MIVTSNNDQPRPGASHGKAWQRWPVLLLFAVLEGSVAGAAQDGLPGAIKGGLFGALAGPQLLAVASIVGKNQRRYLRALLFAAVAEAAGVLILGAMARMVAGFPAWLLAGQVIVLLTGGILVSFGVAREKRWTIWGTIIGAVLGSTCGIVLGIYIGINEGEPPLITAIIAGACGFMLALAGRS